MYCEKCLISTIKKLNNLDVIILDCLYRNKAIMSPCAMSCKKIMELMGDDKSVSITKVKYSTQKLNILGFLESQMYVREKKYYISDDGIKSLDYINNEINMEE